MNKIEVKDELEEKKLPVRWVMCKLGNVIEKMEDGGTPPREDPTNFNGGIPWVVIDDIKKRIFSTKDTLSKKGLKICNAKLWKKGSIILSFGATIGKVGITEVDLSTKQGIAGIEVKSDKIFNDYLYYALLIKKNELLRYSNGTTIKEIRPETIKEKIKLLFPSSIPEQRKIAEILETIDETIEKTDEIIEKYKRIKQGLMQDLLTEGITAFEFEKDKLIHAVKKAFENGDHRFGREENLVSHLSRYLNEFFPGWDVDSEVEKNNERQRPDIIIHKRGTDNNLFAIEVKKNDNLNAIKEDIEKLEDVMLGNYHYEDVVFIGFDIDNFEDVFKFSEKVNFILVSKNGEIKVKSRVRRFKDSPLGRILEEWEGVSVHEIVNVISGGTPSTSRPEYWNGNIPWLSVEDFNSGKRWVFSGVKHITELGLKRSATGVLKKGMLIISARGTVGVVAQLGRSMAFNQSSYGLDSKNKKRLSNNFLYYALRFYINLFLALAYGNVFDTITRKNFKEIKILLPPLLEQHRIASILSQTDETIEKEQNYKEKFRRIKQGLMEDLLTGKVRVNHLIKEGGKSVQKTG